MVVSSCPSTSFIQMFLYTFASVLIKTVTQFKEVFFWFFQFYFKFSILNEKIQVSADKVIFLFLENLNAVKNVYCCYFFACSLYAHRFVQFYDCHRILRQTTIFKHANSEHVWHMDIIKSRFLN